MMTLKKSVLLASLSLSFSTMVFSEISVSESWIRLLPPSVKTTAAYMNITSDQTDKLIGASSSIASRVEIHQSSAKQGMVSMDHVASIEVHQGQPIVLSPQGYHFMVIGLKQALKKGEVYPLTLSFEKEGDIEVSLESR